jgi:ABC-type transport system involved in multi-copper enzyme maturation permease subunit
MDSVNRSKSFKGTIAIIVIYAFVILSMSIAGIFSQTAKAILFEKWLLFTVTFISGTVFVIICLIIQLLYFKRTNNTTLQPVQKYAGENLSCPDFWILKQTPESELNKIQDSKTRTLAKFYCENPATTETKQVDLLSPSAAPPEVNVFGPNDNVTTDTVNAALSTAINNTNMLSSNYHMTCSRMYPDYLAYVDKSQFTESPTTIRCKYIQQCNNNVGNNIPWTNVCP